jgi:dCTP deaminase
MVLSDRSIKEELDKGRIVISPLDPADVQPASVDVHLDSNLRVFKPYVFPYYIDLQQPLDGLTDLYTIPKNGHFALQPGQFVLGSTIEYIEVPDDMMARLEGKSSLGRIGLLIHATAGYVDPGWKGHLTLELANVASMPILLYPRMKISQISFHHLTTPAERPYGTPGLRSKYQGQEEPTATRFHQEFQQSPLIPRASIASLPVVDVVGTKGPSRGNRILKEWLSNSQFRSVRLFAEAVGAPPKTVEDWLYRGVRPSPRYQPKLFELTRLTQFKIEGQVSLLTPP